MIKWLKNKVNWWIYFRIVKKNAIFKMYYQNLTRDEAWEILDSGDRNKIAKYIFNHVPFLE